MKVKPKYLIFLVLSISLVLIANSCFVSFYQETPNWQFFVKNQIGAQSVLNIGKNLTFDENFVYFGDDKNTIYSLWQKNGLLNWKTKLPDHTPFQITQDKDFLYIANFDSHIYKLDKKNGYIIWSFTIPDFFWPDTEVIFDENDISIFFGDRGGFLYALDKQTGMQVWRTELGTIDNTKSFKEGSIHLGFLQQNDEQLFLDHFPLRTQFLIDKKTGQVISQKKITPNVTVNGIVSNLYFGDTQLSIEGNVARQPLFVLNNKEKKEIWSYQSQFKVNSKEIYQHQNRLFYLDKYNQLLTSVKITSNKPNDNNFKQTNFTSTEDFFVDYQENKLNLSWHLKNKVTHLKYLLNNLKNVFSFETTYQEKENYSELTIHHQDNFYKNKFTQVSIEGKFKKENSDEQLEIKGFYYQKDTWKLRAKLTPGKWQYQLTIKTPFTYKKFKKEIEVTQPQSDSLDISNQSLILDNNLFIPLGFQTSIVERNQDGSAINQIGYSETQAPPDQEENYKFLPWNEYLKEYQQQSQLNFFRYGPDNWAPSIWNIWEMSENPPSPNEFKMNLKGNMYGDYLVEQARNHQYKIMMSLFSFDIPYASKKAINEKQNQEVITQYLDYIIARYASMIDIWELSNEAIPSQEWQNFVSDYLNKHDPYKHPITTSLENSDLNHSQLLSRHYYAPIPKNNQELVKQIDEFYADYPDWSEAQIISEFGFEKANYFVRKKDEGFEKRGLEDASGGSGARANIDTDSNSADWLRKFAWIFAMNKTGVMFWNTGERLYLNQSNGNTYLGPVERNYLGVLQKFFPSFTVNTHKDDFKTNHDTAKTYRLYDQNHEIVYLLNLTSTMTESFSLQLVSPPESRVELFNPLTGQLINQITMPSNQQITIPEFSDDLVLKVSSDYEL